METMNKAYQTKEASRISGLDINSIYYWSETLRVITPVPTKTRARYFDLRAVLNFRLVAELLSFGLRPEMIKERFFVQTGGSDGCIYPDEFWIEFIKKRKTYEQHGFYLLFSRWEDPADYYDDDIYYRPLTSVSLQGIFGKHPPYGSTKMKGAIIINMLRLINQVEKQSGEILQKAHMIYQPSRTWTL